MHRQKAKPNAMIAKGKSGSIFLILGLALTFPAWVLAAEPETRSLADRVATLEESAGGLHSWLDRISIGGLIEVEAAYVNVDSDDPDADGNESDLTLATVELGIDVDFVKHVSGHVLLLWEEDETEPLDVDEAFIRLDGEDVVPMYLQAGKMYVPFGNFETHFISDPLTLELGETRESAVVIGYASDLLELSFGVFNGDVDETGKDSHLDSFVASAVYNMPREAIPGLALSAGVSWISNLADSDVLSEEIDHSIRRKINGVGAFFSATWQDRLTLIAEYVGALEKFRAGELAFDDGQSLEPKTWNTELGYAVTDKLTVAARYEGGDDLGDLLPDNQYGIAASYGLFESTTLSLEYLHGEFENHDNQDVLTAQLAFEF
ncbi:LbtU family siderophore porin [Syntrophotalea acetylenica]|nr:LbtU family siderophore porin [Syntrophotalea acetylenica]